MRIIETDAFDDIASISSLAVGETLEYHGTKLTRINAEALEIETKDSHARFLPGRVEVLRGEVHIVPPKGELH